MLSSVPNVYLMGGPNGAGKTTNALRIFLALGVTHFINADAIAQGLSPLDVARAARAAGRLMLEQMETRLARRRFRARIDVSVAFSGAFYRALPSGGLPFHADLRLAAQRKSGGAARGTTRGKWWTRHSRRRDPATLRARA